MPFIDWNAIPTNEVAPGVRIRAPFGENLMISLLEMEEGAVVNRHSHPHEQGGNMLEGTKGKIRHPHRVPANPIDRPS